MKKIFYDHEGEDKEMNLFRKKSKWTPPYNRDLALETYIKAIRDDIHQSLDQSPKHRSSDNLTSKERRALLSLRSRPDIVIKQADKGSVTVVMSRRIIWRG